MSFTPPGILLAPDFTAVVNLDPFESSSISDTVWETVTIDLPEEPIITFPERPNVTDPEQPVAPEITLGEFTPEQLQSLEVETSCQDRVDIVLPGDVELREWTEDTPVFDRTVPDGQLDWSYEEFSYALTQVLTDRYDLLILPTEYYSRLQQRNQAIWDNDQDWFTQRGQENTYEERKDATVGRAVHNFNAFVVIENYQNDLTLKKLFINGRQAHEQILRQHHDVEQKLNFAYVQAVMDNSVKHWNACIQKFNAQIQTYRELATLYIGDINRQGLIIEKLRSGLRISEGLSQYNSAVLGRINAQVTSQKGVIQFFQSQMSLARAELRVELLQAQVDRLEIQIFAELNRALVEEQRQDIVEQEAEIAKVRVIKFEAIKQRLLADIETAETELESAQARFAGDREAFELIQAARIEQHTNFPLEVEARGELLERQIGQDQARGSFLRASTRANADELELRRLRLDSTYVREVAQAEITSEIDKFIAENSAVLATARVAAREAVRQAELDAQRTLAASDITQSLVHELAEG